MEWVTFSSIPRSTGHFLWLLVLNRAVWEQRDVSICCWRLGGDQSKPILSPNWTNNHRIALKCENIFMYSFYLQPIGVPFWEDTKKEVSLFTRTVGGWDDHVVSNRKQEPVGYFTFIFVKIHTGCVFIFFKEIFPQLQICEILETIWKDPNELSLKSTCHISQTVLISGAS